jgi:hypothetical protein
MIVVAGQLSAELSNSNRIGQHTSHTLWTSSRSYGSDAGVAPLLPVP